MISWFESGTTWAALHLTTDWLIRLVMLVYVPQRRSPAAARSWLLLIFIFPIPGIILYAIFGRPYLSSYRIQLQKSATQLLHTTGRHVLQKYASRLELPGPFAQEVILAQNLGDFGMVGGNQV